MVGFRMKWIGCVAHEKNGGGTPEWIATNRQGHALAHCWSDGSEISAGSLAINPRSDDCIAYSGCAAPACCNSDTATGSGSPFESIAPALASATRSLSTPGCPTTNDVVRNAGAASVTA